MFKWFSRLLRRRRAFPCIYELDDFGEAYGVYHFCFRSCRGKFDMSGSPHCFGAGSELTVDDEQCSYCGVPLERRA